MTKEQFFGMYKPKRVFYKNEIRNVDSITIRYDIGSIELISKKRGDLRYRESSDFVNINDCKLILRPFESMTDEERKSYSEMTTEYLGMPFTANQSKNRLSNIKQIEYLISIGIDVFNLKDRGWAVYESEAKND